MRNPLHTRPASLRPISPPRAASPAGTGGAVVDAGKELTMNATRAPTLSRPSRPTLAMAVAATLLLGVSTAGADEPPPPLAPTPQELPSPERPRNTAMMAAGITLTAIGAIGLAIGGALVATMPKGQPKMDFFHDSTLGQSIGGYAALGAGGVLTLTGIPLAIVGGLPVSGTPINPPSRAWPTVALGPASGTLRWTF